MIASASDGTNRRIRAIVDRKFALDDLVTVHEYCESGQAQGKIAVLVSDEAR